MNRFRVINDENCMNVVIVFGAGSAWLHVRPVHFDAMHCSFTMQERWKMQLRYPMHSRTVSSLPTHDDCIASTVFFPIESLVSIEWELRSNWKWNFTRCINWHQRSACMVLFRGAAANKTKSDNQFDVDKMSIGSIVLQTNNNPI